MNVVKFLENTPPWEWPPEAAEVLKESLRSGRSGSSDRMVAARLAGDLIVMDDEMAALLLSIVRNAAEPERLRATAAIAFGAALEESDIEGFDEDDDLSEPPISEDTFDRIQTALREIHMDEREPKELRRRALEASVRAPQDWHRDAIRAAYSSGDEDWKLTAAFGMARVRGFETEILELLKSRNPDIQYEAVSAAGNWEIDAAWPDVTALLDPDATDKPLLLAAIEAAGSIRPQEAWEVLDDLADSDDEEIAEAATEAMQMARLRLEDEEDEDEDDDSPRA